VIGRLPPSWLAVVKQSLAEDLGKAGDITSQAVVPAGTVIACDVVFRLDAVACGLSAAEAVFAQIDPAVRCEWNVRDGGFIRSGEPAGRVSGPARSVLAGERTALNLMAHMSGVASRTARFVKEVAGTRAQIYDTRKTTPLLRELDKYAVRCGGGKNHRVGLFDQVLIKDNHLRLAGGPAEAVAAARHVWGDRFPIEVEVESVEDALAACRAGADVVMLDNFNAAEIRAAVQALAGGCVIEASGGVTLGTVRAVAETGVDRIAVGALTNAGGADVALDEVLPGDSPDGR
jgi:nicotinate-nucleotide pyrophosphorylase (carboxylating)